MRTLILGNSGSGKSTLAARLAADHALPLLALDAIVWEVGKVAVARAVEDVRADLDAFLAAHPDAWVIEGCDGDLVERALPACTELLFLNPGVDVCLARNRARPWEPHKYTSAAKQEEMLPFLLGWVASYPTRDDPRGYPFHRRVFDRFAGPKRELTWPT